MRRHSSIHKLLLFLTGWLATSCICIFNFAPIDRMPQNNHETQAQIDAAAQTREVLENLAGEPYRVAVFPSGAGIFLLAPRDSDIVATPWVDVIGTAPAETVITLNDEIAVAGSDKMFHARVPLEQGLNEIQCVASDLEGDEVVFSILVVFEPQE